VAGEGSGVAERESVNEYREKMMSKAIDKVKKLDQEEYEKRVSILSTLNCQLDIKWNIF
jgi:interferon-induced helicase C domain-containing protein 1